MHTLETIITFVAGSVLSALVNYYTTKINNKKELDMLNLKLTHKTKRDVDKAKKEALQKTIKAKSKILKIIYKLKLNLSLTNNYILETINTSEQEIHKEYFKNHALITDAVHICILNDFDENLLIRLREISGLVNLIWGQRQSYFGYLKEDKEAKNKIREELIGYFNLVSEKVYEAQDYLLNDIYRKN